MEKNTPLFFGGGAGVWKWKVENGETQWWYLLRDFFRGFRISHGWIRLQNSSPKQHQQAADKHWHTHNIEKALYIYIYISHLDGVLVTWEILPKRWKEKMCPNTTYQVVAPDHFSASIQFVSCHNTRSWYGVCLFGWGSEWEGTHQKTLWND